MNYIEKLIGMNVGWGEFCMIVLLLICAAPAIWEKVSKFIGLFGFETKWSLAKKEQDNKSVELADRVNQIEERLSYSIEQSIIHDKRLEEKLDELTARMQEHNKIDDERTVASFRSKIYRLHGEFMTKGYVTKSGLKTFAECVGIYTLAGGNDIVHDKLEKEVLELPIKGE